MDAFWLGRRLLLLLGLANTAPLVARHWLGSRGATPLDGGLRFVDGSRCLGRRRRFSAPLPRLPPPP